MAQYKRNSNGTGTVRKLSGKRRRPFQAVAPAYKDKDGNFVQKTIGYFATRQEALDALALHRLAPKSTDEFLTFEGLYEQWKEQGYKNVGEQAKYAYKAAWDKFTAIYKYKVVDVKTPQLQFCVDRAAVNGAGHSSLVNMKLVASKLEKFAMQQDIINKNYAQFIVIPKKENTEKAVFNDFQLKKIEEGAKDNIGLSRHILILCYTGWRIQEYLNLTVFDYDKDNHTLRGGLKTEAGKNRLVPVPDKVRSYVEEYLADQGSLYTKTVSPFRNEFYATLTALGIQAKGEKKFTPHSCRHTYNSLLAKNGIPVETRMKLLGQTDTKTNINVYTHADIETLKNAVADI